jgi:hypothetical protein
MKNLKPLNYYSEHIDNVILFSPLRFLGIEYVEKNPMFRFETETGIQFRRQVNDTMQYTLISPEIDYSEEEIKNIKFKELICDDKCLDKSK